MKIFKILLFTFFLFVLGGTLVSAETVSPGVSGDAVLIADVNLYNAKIISQEGNKINLSFDVANKEGSQAGLHYEIQLIKQTKDKGQFLIDKYVSTDVFSLNQNQSIKKEISYIYPPNISGTYKLLITINNKTGLMLALGFTDDVEIMKTTGFINIITESCYLTVKDEKNTPKYSLLQGVDIDKNEKLMLNCLVLNDTKEDTTVTPFYETRWRGDAGEVVLQTGGDLTPILLEKGKHKIISQSLPKATKPQAYSVIFTLKGNQASNKVVAHYVLRGSSATIQNFSIDKDSYKKGDTINTLFSWSPSADSFSGNRLKNSGTTNPLVNLNLNITSNNKNCIEPISQTITYKNLGLINLPLEVIKNCNSPKATISLLDENGEVLDSKELLFNTDNKDRNNNIIYIIFGLLVVLGLVYYFINLNKKQNETTI